MFKEEIKLNYQPDICSGLCAIKIKDINRNKSNWLLKSLLMNNGVKPLNNTLDRLAYVTLLTNVPTAVYDANKISNELNVKFASPRQEFIGFGQKKYMLDSKDIIVESNNLTIGLAGVLGSEQCGVSNQTKDIIIEVANFNYVSIRETAIRLDIKTDAARRFSKEISNYLLMVTLSYIFEQFNNLQISYPVIKVNPSASIKIDVNLQECVELIGISLTKEVIQKSLTYLGFG
jgi:phenylalanyl-tRNA synthetase beta chain